VHGGVAVAISAAAALVVSGAARWAMQGAVYLAGWLA